MTFFERFDDEWGFRLGLRRDTFRKAFEFLTKNHPRGPLIVETGCARQADNWAGDGQSTYLFDRFVSEYGGQVISVDIDPESCGYSRSIVGVSTTVVTDDSVPFLRRLARELVQKGRQVDLLYLDSLDWNPINPIPSAVQPLKELCSIAPALGPNTLVMVDDSFRMFRAVRVGSEELALIGDQGIGGKATYLAEYFQQLGTPFFFESYQCGWVMGS